MGKIRQDRGNTSFKLGITIGIIVLLMVCGYWILPRLAEDPAPPQMTSEPAASSPRTAPSDRPTVSKTPAPVIRFREDDDDLKELMERRKKEYGLDKGVDMIVREGERITVGGITVPMSEISEKIRRKQGQISESDLAPAGRSFPGQVDIEQLFSRLKEAETRLQELEQGSAEQSPSAASPSIESGAAPGAGSDAGAAANQSSGVADAAAMDPKDLEEEKKRLSAIVRDFSYYKDTLRELHEKESLAAADDFQKTLNERIEELEQRHEEDMTVLTAEWRRLIKEELARTDIPSEKEDADAGGSQDASAAKPGQTEPSELTADALTLQEMRDRMEIRLEQLRNRKSGSSDSPEETSDSAITDFEMARLRALGDALTRMESVSRRIEEYKRMTSSSAEEAKKTLRDNIRALRRERDDLEASLVERVMPEQKQTVYGVYVVQPGDNIWNIHFRFLSEYVAGRDLALSRNADEPLSPGVSSGVGKILKFAENMVYIYNLRERELSDDLNLIHPLSKIVIFNMSQVVGLLDRLDRENIRHIRYDGENLWISAP